MNENLPGSDETRRRIVELVTRAEAIVEAMELATEDGRWAMTAFSRYRLCQLLDVMPYEPYDEESADDPVVLLEQAAQLVGELDVPIEDLAWRLALGDALQATMSDIRMVRDARDI